MSSLVFFLVMLAAVTHASWNFFSKKISGDLVSFWVGSICVDLVLLPVTIYIIYRQGFNFAGSIPIMISAIAHAIYYFTLFSSYRLGDISAVYPIARGSGIAITTLIATCFLHDTISNLGLLGIILIILGVLLIGFSGKLTRNNIKSYGFALLTGLTTAAYSLADSRGAGMNHPIVCINVMSMTSLIAVAPLVFRHGVQQTLIKSADKLKYAPAIGLGSLGTYLIIMFAFSLSDQASCIVALRECSVVIGSILGFLILKEKPTLKKIIGIVLITCGLILIKMV